MSFVTNQQEALDKLKGLRHGAIWMALGAGKTKVALDLAKSRQHDFDVILWIAPASLIHEAGYRREIELRSQGLERDIVFQSIEGISQSDAQYLDVMSLVERRRAFTIVDESLTIKNVEAKRTARLLEMRDRLPFRFVLNGTPTTKGLLDLWAQLEFVSPRILNMTETQFANHFLVYKDDGYMPWRRWSKPANEEALVEMIRPYIVECDLALDVQTTMKPQWFDMTEEQADAYKKYKEKLKKESFDDAAINIFMVIAQKAQHIYTPVPEKLDALSEIVESTDRVYVLAKYLDEVDAIKERFGDACIEYTGRHKDDLDLFRSGEKRMCASIYGSGSFGLNLQQANAIVFYSQTWDYGQRLQSIGRLRRKGQTRDITVHDFRVHTGLERMILHCQEKKQNTLQHVKECIQKEGVEAL